MRNYVKEHLDRVKVAVLKKLSAASIASWLTENTTYAMQPYSYKDHEFQEKVLMDTSTEVNIRKCAQVGLSEASARLGLALVNVLTPYTVCYTLPTAHFAGTFVKTRMDPIIDGSDVMKGNIHRTNNNNEVKQFSESFLFIRGAASSNAPISIPVDHLIHDEVDFSDQEVLGQYTSRLGHSKWKRYTRLSTPTLPKFGIDLFFQESRRFFNFCKCHHCGHFFIPDYYDHVKIPEYTGKLEEINKATLTRIRWEEAEVHCPKCGLQPSLQIEHREWVCENPQDNHLAAGYQVTPFDAPNVNSRAYLVKASTGYDRAQDFVNFALGLPMADSEATLTEEDFAVAFVNQLTTGYETYVMGVDVGNVYHFTIGAVDPYDNILVVHTEEVPMGRARARYAALREQYNVVCTVIDSTPHSETVMALQDEDPNLYASVYTKSKKVVTHEVVEKDEDFDKGREFQRQVNVNRSKAFDAYMEFLRQGHLVFRDSDNKKTIIDHHCSMKRVKTFDTDSGEMTYSWQKSDGHDHFHHSGLYCWVASKIRALGRHLTVLPIAQGFKMKLKTES